MGLGTKNRRSLAGEVSAQVEAGMRYTIFPLSALYFPQIGDIRLFEIKERPPVRYNPREFRLRVRQRPIFFLEHPIAQLRNLDRRWVSQA